MGAGAMILTAAIRNADLERVASLVGVGVEVDRRDADGLTPLMVAAGLGQARTVELLLTAGAEVHTMEPRSGSAAIHKAAQSGDPDTIRLLLDRGAFVDQQNPILGHTALMDAVIYKHEAAVDALLARGARTSIRNHWGEAALDLARRDGLSAIAAAIERRDASDAAIVSDRKLFPAIMAGDADEVRRLIADGADVDARLPMTGGPDDDYTPLAVAAREGDADMVRVLMEAGADPRRTIGLFRGTALHEAAYFGHADAVRALTAARDPALGPPPELDAQGSLNGMTALHDAVWHGHLEAARALVEAGHPLHLRTHSGLTARELAARYGYGELARWLEEAERWARSTGEVTS